MNRLTLETRKQLAARLQVSEQTILRWDAAGLPRIKVSGTVRYPQEHVDRWLLDHISAEEVAS